MGCGASRQPDAVARDFASSTFHGGIGPHSASQSFELIDIASVQAHAPTPPVFDYDLPQAMFSEEYDDSIAGMDALESPTFSNGKLTNESPSSMLAFMDSQPEPNVLSDPPQFIESAQQSATSAPRFRPPPFRLDSQASIDIGPVSAQTAESSSSDNAL